MAPWIVHLRIAENLLAEIPALDESMFAVGNIAPDSGVPDEKWENFTPPAEVTHFQLSEDVHRNCGDLDFYRRYVESVSLMSNPGDFSFLLGYFFHLVTDNLWSIHVGRPTKEGYEAQFAADNNFIWEVKKDWYGLDFIYLREHPACLFWRVFLHADYHGPGLDFLPGEAIRQRVAYIKQYYQRSDDETLAMCKRPFIYLSASAMDDFVRASSDRPLAIYKYLCLAHGETGGHSTALAIGV
jgi:Zinc dependent phospholipase C